MEKGRKKLAYETNIIEIIKSRRLVRLAMEHLLPSKKYRQLEKQARFTIIDPDLTSADESSCDDAAVKQDQADVRLVEFEMQDVNTLHSARGDNA